MKTKIFILLTTTAIAIAATACSFSTANLSSLKASKDKAGTQESTSFKAGETVYAAAVVSNAGDKNTVRLYMTADDVTGMKKGDVLKGSEVKVELPSSGTATYELALPASFTGGKYDLVAEMINEKGEKKDSKTAVLTITGGAGPVETHTDADKPTGKDDKDKDKDKDEEDN